MGRRGSRADLFVYIITVKPFHNSKGSLLDKRFELTGMKSRRSARKSSCYVATKEQVVFFS